MLIQKDFLPQLKAFGLNSYESRLWTALLSKGTATAGELSDIANVPRSRAYDVLESLERKGFIIMKLGKPIKYVALSPEAVFERVKKKVVEDAEEKTNMLNKLKGTELLAELKLLHKSSANTVEPFDMSGSIKGRKNVYSHIENLIKEATKSVTIMTTVEGLLRKKAALSRALKKAKDRGVKVTIAAPLSNINSASPEAKSAISEMKELCELRNASVKARFCIIDSSNLVFMVSDDKETSPDFDTGIWVTTPFFTSAFEKMFETATQSIKMK
ncbi:TrmB family transcriptional regulator [Candidatus Woesearchaeota archaeon]|nr:TrmB family transcriptional regulator [Candidatus Woesearchaeota archaeon]